VRNLSYSGLCIADAGLLHEVVIAMMALPPGCTGAHTPEFYLETLEAILADEVPFHSVCFKDASGTATPAVIYETIKLARQRLPEATHIQVHTHETAGTSIAAYRAALDAGADGVDLSMAPVSGGTCQPDVVTMWHALRGSDFDLGLDIEKVLEVEEVFKDCMSDYFMPPESRTVEPLIPFSPMPGGALTANTQMMRDNNILDRYPEVIQAMTEVVTRGGFATSVTPVSQFYFQQAFNNVMFGKWKKMAEGYGKMVLGYFGKTPVEPDPELVEIAAEQLGLEFTTEDPRAINDADPKKGIGPAKELLEAAGLPITDENVFIAATCKAKGIAFLRGEAEVNVRKVDAKAAAKPAAGGAADRYRVTVSGRSFDVALDGDRAVVNGKSYPFDVAAADDKTESSSAGNGQAVKTEMPGKVLRVAVDVGDRVRAGDLLLVLEALKMEIEIKSPSAGQVSRVAVASGQQVNSGDELVAIN
jgi:pyruvate carboxylase subunit B